MVQQHQRGFGGASGLEKYKRVKVLGRGSFGLAVLAENVRDHSKCVIKEVDVSKMPKVERDAAHQEAQLLSQLHHPHVVSCKESFLDKGKLCIVMDYCSKGDLYAYLNGLKGVPMAEGAVLDWFVQICLALKHVHDRKVLHRDLKTQNIFIAEDNTLKLGDFGVSKVLSGTAQLAYTAVGTPYYLSPEICQNKPYDAKSDVWSLGCVLYEMTTLKHAFDASTVKLLVLKIIRGIVPPLPGSYSQDLRKLISSMLNKTPSKRPSINEILAMPFLRSRVDALLPADVRDEEFSHTVLHGKPRPGALSPRRKEEYKPVEAALPSQGGAIACKKQPRPVGPTAAGRAERDLKAAEAEEKAAQARAAAEAKAAQAAERERQAAARREKEEAERRRKQEAAEAKAREKAELRAREREAQKKEFAARQAEALRNRQQVEVEIFAPAVIDPPKAARVPERAEPQREQHRAPKPHHPSSNNDDIAAAERRRAFFEMREQAERNRRKALGEDVPEPSPPEPSPAPVCRERDPEPVSAEPVFREPPSLPPPPPRAEEVPNLPAELDNALLAAQVPSAANETEMEVVVQEAAAVEGRFMLAGEVLQLPNITSVDSVAGRVEALRIFLEDKLGLEKFLRAYQKMDALEEDDDEEVLFAAIIETLGPEGVGYVSLIHQLLVCEDAMCAANNDDAEQ